MREKLDSSGYLTIFAISFIGFLIAFFLGVWVGSKSTVKPVRGAVSERKNFNDDFNPRYEEVNHIPDAGGANVRNKTVEVKVDKKKPITGKTKSESLKQKSLKSGVKKKKEVKSKNTKKTKAVEKKSNNKKILPKSKTEKRYMLQIGAYKRLKDANRLKLRFEKKGYSVFIVKEKGKRTVFYKVRIGTFYSKKIAYRVKKKLEREEKIKAWLVPIK